MPSLARWCFRHRWIVLAGWVLALVLVTVVSKAAGISYATKYSLPNSPSTQALSILQHDFPAASGDSDQIVLQAKSGSVTSAPVRSAAESMLAKVAKLPHVASVISPYSSHGASQVSKDGKIAFATVNFDAQAQDLSTDTVNGVIHTAQAARSSSLNVQLTGQAIENAQPQKSSNSTIIGILLALIVLGVAFGAMFAAVTPIVTALVAIGIGYGVTGLLTHVLTIVSFAPILGVLIGLGVGVDYALFIVTRHRTGVRAGRSIEDSVTSAANTAGRAVFFAGLTVVIAMLGQFALGVSFLDGAAVAAAVTVALTMLAALTLLPALLAFIGPKVLSRRERRRISKSGPEAESVTSGFWYRWSRSIERHTGVRAVVSLLVMVIIAIPVFTLKLGLDDAGTDPVSSTSRQAYDLLAKGFGPGFNAPFELVGTLHGSADKAAFARVVKAASHQPGVVAVTPPVVSPSGSAAVAVVYPSTAPQATQTAKLLDTLRTQVVPGAETGSSLRVLIGGVTPTEVDFSKNLASKLPEFVAVVVVLAFLLLLLVFRSLVIPLMASVMNLLSVGAALGVMNAVFGWGWGSSVFGFGGTAPVEVFLPVIMFSVLFGLSMDYEVFLVSRIREEWLRTGDNRDAVTTGQTATGRVITAAATIMILVFVSFLLVDNIVIRQFGVGLAAAIFVDAFVVRTVLVPSLMHLCGRANWWLPRWLDRALPHVAIDVPDTAPPRAMPRPPVRAQRR
ncbi:MAG TPA: MMPL family transporter [Streptosporangiaceae bacterium]|jgi:RND superfamily putative drug exporter|nr:MMPL family transporter [Streptosporangiaceae bacterium]